MAGFTCNVMTAQRVQLAVFTHSEGDTYDEFKRSRTRAAIGTGTGASMSTLFDKLGHKEQAQRIAAAVSLGHERPGGACQALIAQLAQETAGKAAAACCAALALLGDKSAVEPLASILKACPEDHVWDVAHTLGRLTGVAPLLPLGAEPPIARRTWLEALRRERQPSVSDVREEADCVRFSVEDGVGRIRLDYDPPPPGTYSWPRWDRSLFVGERALYGLGSTCDTCELVLQLAGWPLARAFDRARSMSASMQDETPPSAAWISLWAPLFCELQTGHYVAVSLALRVELVRSAKTSWGTVREGVRQRDTNEYVPEHVDECWPGTPHYQGPTFAGAARAYWSVLPTQELAGLDESRVEYYVEQIRRGKKPTVLVLGWLEERHVNYCKERFVVLCVLDGHHKLEAYARCEQPAQLIGLFPLENRWGPGSLSSEPLLEAIGQLNGEAGQLSSEVLSV